MPEDMKSRDRCVLVLLSGGIDSTAVVSFYLAQRYDVTCLFVDYGQLAAPKELLAARRVTEHYGIPLRCITCTQVAAPKNGLILGRNAFLLFTALMEFDAPFGVIAMGIHAGTPYYDCSGSFAESARSIVDGYADGRIRIGVPFLEWSKRDIWEFCKDRHVPVHMTYSCELGEEQPCGKCSSCKDLEALNACPKLKS